MAWTSAIPLPPPPSCSYGGGSDPISATLIFNKKEMKQYMRWQRHTQSISHARTGLGRLPTAQQYDEFQRWREDRKARDDEDVFRGRAFTGAWTLSSDLGEHLAASKRKEESSRVREDSAVSMGDDSERDRQYRQTRVATTCKHVLHPINANAGAAGKHELCPCCTVSSHVRYMSLLTQAVDRTSDSQPPEEVPFEDARDGEREGLHDNALKAWRAGKLAIQHIIDVLEDEATKEDVWAAMNPDFDYELDSSCDDSDNQAIMSAARAVSMYWESVDGRCESRPASSHTSQTSAAVADAAEAKSKNAPPAKRHVSFSASTDFSPGRLDIYFSRRSPRYEPGKWTIQDQIVYDELDGADADELNNDEHDDDHDIEQSFFDSCHNGDCDYDSAEDTGSVEWTMLIKATARLHLGQNNQSSETVTETPVNSLQSSVNDISSQSDAVTEVDVEVVEVGVEAGNEEANKIAASDIIFAHDDPIDGFSSGPKNHNDDDEDAWETEEEGSGSDFDEDEDEKSEDGSDEDEAEDEDDDDSDWEDEDEELDDAHHDGGADFIVFGY